MPNCLADNRSHIAGDDLATINLGYDVGYDYPLLKR